MPNQAKNIPRKIYLAGPMTGYEHFNFPAFQEAAFQLRARGYEVFSPHEQGWGNGNPKKGTSSEQEYRKFLAEDLKQVALSDMVVTLPGWVGSRGANLEVYVANHLEIPVKEYEEIV